MLPGLGGRWAPVSRERATLSALACTCSSTAVSGWMKIEPPCVIVRPSTCIASIE